MDPNEWSWEPYLKWCYLKVGVRILILRYSLKCIACVLLVSPFSLNWTFCFILLQICCLAKGSSQHEYSLVASDSSWWLLQTVVDDWLYWYCWEGSFPSNKLYPPEQATNHWISNSVASRRVFCCVFPHCNCTAMSLNRWKGFLLCTGGT